MTLIIPTGKILLGRPSHRWLGNIRIDLKEIAVNTRSSVDAAQDRDYLRILVNTELNLRIP